MKHVAKAAKVSLMTVSLALRKHPSIPETTRRRISSIAEKLGYRPNPFVSALMANLRSKRTTPASPVVAFINALPKITHWKNSSSMQRLLGGVRQRGQQLGYRVEEFALSAQEVTETRLFGILRSRGIRGVIFAPFPKPNAQLELNWGDFACAALGYTLSSPRLHRAVNHQAHTLRLAVSELRNLHYERIGLAIGTQDDQRVDHNWLSSFLYERHLASLSGVQLPLFIAETWNEKPILKWFHRFRPDAIITTHFELTQILKKHELISAHDLGIAHLHLTPEMKGCSGIEQNDELIGAAALDLVIEQLHANTKGLPEVPKVVQIEGRWVAGTTTRQSISQ